MHGIRQFLCRVQDALQPSEAAVPLQQRTFPFRRGAPFPVKRERRAYRLDVVLSFCFLLNAIGLQIKHDGSDQLRVEQVMRG